MDRLRSAARRHRAELVAVVLLLSVTLPIVQPHGAQQASRMALTAAIWDDHSFWIDDYPLGLDQAEHDGHIVSDKGPGQPVLAVPAYAAYRLLGGEPATVLRVDGNLGLWVVTVWSCTLPAVALLLMMRRAIARIAPRVADAGAISLALGTLLLPFATVLFGHVLSTAFAVGAWMLLTTKAPSRAQLLAAGGLIGLSVTTEYQMIFPAVAIALHALYAHRSRVGWFVLGGLPPAAGLMAYQWAVFGSPFTYTYSSRTFAEKAEELGIERNDISPIENVVRVLVGDRGLVLSTPVLVPATIGLVLLARRAQGPVRTAYLSALAGAGALVILQMLWGNPTGGDSPGARYATAAAALMAPGLAIAWQRWRTSCIVCAVVSGIIMVSATWTVPLVGVDTQGSAGGWIQKLVRGEVGLTIYEMVLGPVGAVLLPVGAAAAGYLALRTHEDAQRAEAADPIAV